MTARIFSDYFTTWHRGQEMRRTAKAAVGAGYAVVPVRPGGKEPICTLAARDRNRQPDHLCGVHHAITDPAAAERIFKRLTKEVGADLNIGIVAAPSHLVVVDADTPEAVNSFLSAWAEAEEDAGYLTRSPTVSTPGTRRGAEWRHHDGGHWYFTVPEGIEMPANVGQLIGPGGYDVRWGWLMTVAPPSKRAEGLYESHGEVLDVPAWLLGNIRHHAALRLERAQRSLQHYANDTIARWSMSVAWVDLLEPDGWRDTNKLDRRCGCPVFEKPGGGSSGERSAIGHDDDCELYENVEGHGPLHLWTTDPPEPLASWCIEHGTQTITKLQYVAITRHGGEVDEAKVALSIDDPLDDAWLEAEPDEVTTTPAADQSAPEAEVHWRPDLPTEVRTRAIQLAGLYEVRHLAEQYRTWRKAGDTGMTELDVATIDLVPNVATVGHRADGVALLYPRRVSSVWGPSEVGKSWLGMALCIDTIERGGHAVYIDLEDDPQGFGGRLELLGKRTGITYLRPWVLGDQQLERIEGHVRGAQLVVVDSLDALLSLLQLDGNSNVAVRTAGNLLKRWAYHGAAVLTVDHATEKLAQGEKATTAIGSSAKKALVDGVMLRADRETVWRPGAEDCTTMVMIGKDRHGDVKRHAELANDEATFGRIARLRLRPGIEGAWRPELVVERPPTYAEEPERFKLSAEQVDGIREAAIEALTAAGGDGWVSQRQLFKAAGNIDGNRGVRPAVEQLLDDLGAAVERQEVTHPNSPSYWRYRWPREGK